MGPKYSNRAAVLILVWPSSWFPVPLGVSTQSRTAADATFTKEYQARVTEQLAFCLDTLVSEFNKLDEKYSLPTRIDIADQLVPLLAQGHSARARTLLDAVFAQALEAVKKEDQSADKVKPPVYGQPSLVSTIGRIIQIASRLDPKLGKAYAKAFHEMQSEILEKDPRTSLDRLELALRLIDSDPNWAVTIAKESLRQTRTLTTSILGFLYQLSQKDPGLADQFFSSLLDSITVRSGRDVNDLLLLGSYVTGSSVVARLSAQGLVSLYVPYKPLPEPTRVSASTATLFLRVASGLLLDVNRYNINLEQPVWGREGDLVAITILTRQVNQLLPESETALAERKAVLASYIAAERNSSMEKSIEEWRQKLEHEKGTRESPSESRDDLLERAGKSTRSDERDELYFRAAEQAIAKGDYGAAFEITDKISAPARESVSDFITLTVARGKLDVESDTAREWAKRISDPTQRSYLLILIARRWINSRSKDTNQAMEILNEAEANVREVKESAEKVAVLAGVGNVYLRIEQNSAYLCLQNAIVQANGAEKLSATGDINRLVKVGNSSSSYSLFGEKDLSLWELISQQSRRDFFATVPIVDSIKNPLMRIGARIALYKGADSERK